VGLRVVFIAPEEPSVMPIFFDKVLPRLGREAVAVAVVSPVYKRSTWLSQARRFVHSFGVRAFAVEVSHYLAQRLSPSRSVKGIARSHRIRVLTPADVNDPAFIEELRAIGPDVVVSVSCPQLFGAELLALPRLGCINVHSSLLPHYRGMLPTFWVLARGESGTGVTVHYMSAAIDEGGIVAQREIPISPDETLQTLMRTTKAVAADLVLETIEGLRAGPLPALPNPVAEGSYFSFPEREDVARFRALGRRMR
jgi:methionyl-tRNA formyltransferase